MIIGINGAIGSGKDTVGELIQKHSEQEWEIRKFGFKLKQIASLALGIPVEKFEDQDFKKSELPKEWSKRLISWSDGWDTIHDEYPLNFDTSLLKDDVDRNAHIFADEIKHMTVREFLQKLGTEACRDQVHQDFWVNALMSEYNNTKRWIITDLRFPNEYQAIKNYGGICVNVNRPGIVKGIHPSETSLDNYKFDYYINNDGSLEQLSLKIKEFLLKLNYTK